MNQTIRDGSLWGMALAAAVGLLMSLEGLELKPYVDIANVVTVCYGETRGVQNRVYSEAECEEFLKDEVYRIGKKIIKDQPNITVGLLASGVSFVYNIGDGAYSKSTYRKQLMNGSYTAACNEMFKWVYVTQSGKKVVSRGLKNRRNKEVALCLSGLPTV